MIYSSTDVARETGMTTEGLRFYEKNGIIKVRKNESNGYRAYEIMQVPLLRMAKILNTYGLPLSQVGGFFHQDDSHLGELHTALEDKQKELRAELWWKGRVLERLERQSGLVRRAANEPEAIWFESLPSLAYLEYYGAEKVRKNEELRRSLEEWVPLMPVVYPAPVLHQEDLDNPSAYCPAGFLCHAGDMEELGLSLNRHIRILPARQYLCRISSQDDCSRIDHPYALAPLRETAERMNLQCVGDVFFMSFAVTSLTEETSRLYYQVLMPVTPR